MFPYSSEGTMWWHGQNRNRAVKEIKTVVTELHITREWQLRIYQLQEGAGNTGKWEREETSNCKFLECLCSTIKKQPDYPLSLKPYYFMVSKTSKWNAICFKAEINQKERYKVTIQSASQIPVNSLWNKRVRLLATR